MKDPAFLFYSSDFLNGVSDLTMEERGQYITLLCLQHQKGELSDKTIRLSVGSVSVDVLNKFSKNEAGNFYQKRLSDEIEKRKKFTESRRTNGSRGGRPPKDKKPSGFIMDNLMEDINENDSKEDLQEIKLNKNGFFLNQLPKEKLLSEMDIGKVIQFIRIKTKTDIDEMFVSENWEAFKIDNFEKKEWKNNFEDVVSHFRNSLKIQIERNAKNNWNGARKDVNSEQAERIANNLAAVTEYAKQNGDLAPSHNGGKVSSTKLL